MLWLPNWVRMQGLGLEIYKTPGRVDAAEFWAQAMMRREKYNLIMCYIWDGNRDYMVFDNDRYKT